MGAHYPSKISEATPVLAGNTAYWTVRVKNDRRDAAFGEKTAQRPCKQMEIRLIAAIHQIRIWQTIPPPYNKHERVEHANVLADHGDTAEPGMLFEQVGFEWRQPCVILFDGANPRPWERRAQRR